MSNDKIRQIFFKWADEYGVDKASHEEWNKFLSVWNLPRPVVVSPYAEMIPAPAICQTCGTRHTAPTTGMVQYSCALCGGALATEVPAPHIAKSKMRIYWERGMFWHTDCEKRHRAIMKERGRSRIECLACGKVGIYPVGGVGEICCEVLI